MGIRLTQWNRDVSPRFSARSVASPKMAGWGMLMGLGAWLGLSALAQDTYTPAKTPEPPALGKYLSDPDRERIDEMRSLAKQQKDLAAAERKWASTVQKQVLADMIALYKAETEGKVDITMAGFDGPGKMAPDGGYGPVLRIVKRYRQDIGGVMKTTYVNEHWHVDDETGGLVAPEEIRVRTQVFNGEPKAFGGEKLYVTDRFRVAWDEDHQASLYREPMYDTDEKNGETRVLQRRVPVGAPFNCSGCHSSKVNRFAPGFLEPGETRNFEAIVQDSQFELPPRQHKGFAPYMRYLEQRVTEKTLTAEQAKAIRTSLETREALHKNSQVENLVPALEQNFKGNMFSWLGEDVPFPDPAGKNSPLPYGVYQSIGDDKWYREAFDSSLEYEAFAGRDRAEDGRVWWTKKVVVPLPKN